jgi:hypothetical protein
MHNLGYILNFTIYSKANGIQRFQLPNAFDDVHIELFVNDAYDAAKPLLKVNDKHIYIPDRPFGSERSFFTHARKNPPIDDRYQLDDVQGVLTGSSPVAAHLAYDSHLRLSQYDPFEEQLRLNLLENIITDAQYADLRWRAQMYTKRKISIIGRNLSDFPPFGKSSAAQKATRDAIVNGKVIDRARLQHRPATDQLAKIFRGVGTGVVVISAATSVYRIAQSDHKLETAAKEAGSWGGAVAGGEAGMLAGAEIGGAIGLCFAGAGFAPGAAFGGFIGGIAGGIGGSIWGAKIVDQLHHHPSSSFLGFGGGSCGGGGASGSW